MRLRPCLLGALLLTAACSSSKAPPPPRYPTYYPPPQPAPAPAPAAPAPPGGAANVLGAIAQLTSSLPCPPPGLPAALTANFDCASMRSISNAVSYVPRAVISSQLAPFVDHRTTGLTGPVKDQQQVGACAGFAMSAVMDTAIRRMGRGDVVAPLHVFAKYQGIDLGRLKGVPLTAEPVWPYDPARACQFAGDDAAASGCGSYYNVPPGSAKMNPVLQGELARADQYGYYRIDAFERMSGDDVDQIAALLADGEAVWVALDFYRPSWESPDVKRTGYLPYYPPQQGLGHGVALQGYRPGAFGRDFLFQNSWGESWGQHGYAWIPESMLRTHLLYAYRVRVSPANGPSSAPPTCPPGSTSLLGVCLPPASALPSVPGGWPAGAPTSIPAGLPSTVPSSLPSCPAGSVPNPLTGGCVAVPAPQ